MGEHTVLADFSRAAARAHSMLQCTASPPGLILLNFWIPVGLVLTVLSCLFLFDSFLFVSMPLCFSLTL